MKFKKVFFLSLIFLISTTKIFSQVVNNYDPEIDSNNLMLVDATLELNDAMLAGVKASLDTLKKPDPDIKNSNDVKEILQRMKRAKDRTQLIPYLEYMNDSLTLDCNRLRTQKQDILSRLNPYLEHLRTQDSLAKVKQQPITIAATSGKANKKTEKKQPVTTTTTAKDTFNKKQEVAEKNKPKEKEVKTASPKYDTVIVYDLVKKPTPQPAKEKNSKATPADSTLTVKQKPIKKIDTVIVIDVQPKQTAKPKTDTVAAIKNKEKKQEKASVKNDTITVAKKPAEPVKKIDTIAIVKKEEKKITEPAKPLSKRDSLANRIQHDVMEVKIKKDSVKKTEAKQIVQKKDTATSVSKATVITKTVEQKPVATNPISSADSIKKIKSEFFHARAQKAIMEKKTKQAEEYLNKSIELWRDNYEAWMTLAKQDGLAGSFTKALSEYQECAKIDSTKPKLYYNIASLYLQNKKKAEAVQYYTRAISIDPEYILAYMERASIYSDWKQYNAAVKDYDRVLELNKNYHFAYKARGMVKQLNRMFSAAVDDFTRYLIFEETDPSAFYYRGLAKIGNNELLEGCLDLSKSAEMGYAAAEKAIKRSCE